MDVAAGPLMPSSSPVPPAVDPMPVKRAPRTYGRRREISQEEASSALPSAASKSTASSRTAILSAEAPPKLDMGASFSHGDVEDEEARADTSAGEEDASSKYAWSWRQKMEELDGMEELEDAAPAVAGGGSASASMLKDSTTHQRSNHVPVSTRPNSPTSAAVDGQSSAIFGGSLTTLTASSSQPDQVAEEPSSPSSPPAPPRRRVLTKRTAIYDSDSELEPAPPKLSLSPPSPAFPHPIATPHTGSSPTPPSSCSSEPDEAAKLSKRKAVGKGKAVARAAARGVPPLRFDQDLDSASAPFSTAKADAKGKGKRSSMTKIKPPTKKELLETMQDRQRIVADQAIVIPRETQAHKYTKAKLMHQFAQLVPSGIALLRQPSSDPIQQFSSSPVATLPPGPPSTVPVPLQLRPRTPGAGPSAPPLSHDPGPIQRERRPLAADASLPALDSDSDTLPDVGSLLAEQTAAALQATRKRDLAALKQRALAARAAQPAPAADDDDDALEVVDARVGERAMHVVAAAEAEERKALRKMHIRPSEGRKRQLRFGGVSPVKKPRDGSGSAGAGGDRLFLLGAQGQKGTEHRVRSQGELNRLLVSKAAAESLEMTRKKEEEWVRRGGRVVAPAATAAGATVEGIQTALKAYAERGLKAVEEPEVDDMEEDEDGSDAEWTPAMRGSASPGPKDGSGGEDEAEDVTMVNDEENGADNDDEDMENLKPRTRRLPQILVSDSEDENAPPPATADPGSSQRTAASPPHAHRHSVSASSLGERTEDEGDKENNTRLMYDKSEDKENKAVVRHAARPALEARSSSFRLPADARRLGAPDSDEDAPAERAPLQDILDEDDPFASPVPSFAARLQQASPPARSPTPASTLPPSLAPRFGGDCKAGFSQFSDEEGGGAAVQPVLRPAFADFFRSEDAGPGLARAAFSQFIGDEESGLGDLRRHEASDDIPLTLDVGLQPALEVDENLRRQADAIFEKEQEYVLEAAAKKPHKKAELYVNDHGFLTQTRPDVSSPEVYRVVSPSQRTQMLGTQRPPLRTLSMSDDLAPMSPTQMSPTQASPEPARRRLAKRDTTPAARASTSPSPAKRAPANAFEVLARNAQARAERARAPLGRSEFVEAEAQESDEDEMFGFGLGAKGRDEGEEDGAELDATLEGLVDDAPMDEDTQAAERVLEKVKEHMEEDDQQLEKLHKDAVEGKFRVKRRGRGVDMDDSDEDEEDEEARRIRRKMGKRRRIDGDSLEALGQNEETRAFYDVYQNELEDDENPELAHLLVADTDMAAADEGEDAPREVVTAAALRAELRARAQEQQEADASALDPDDVSWVDRDVSDDDAAAHVRIRPVSTRAPAGASRRPALRGVDFDGDLGPLRETETERRRLLTWAKTEGRTRNMGTGRNVVGAAVTGHGKKVKAGGGSLRAGQPASTLEPRPTEPRKLKAGPSVLSAVADRSSRFEAC